MPVATGGGNGEAPRQGNRGTGSSPVRRMLLFIHSYWPEHSPPQRRWVALAGHFRSAGWHLDVVTPLPHDSSGSLHVNGAKAFHVQAGPHSERIVRVPYLPHPNSSVGKFVDQCFSAILSIPASFRVPAVDLVLVTAPSLPVLASAFVVARFRRVPLVVEMRDAWPDLARDARLVKGRVKSLAEWMVETIQRRADLVVTVTEGFAETLRARGLKRVATVSNGVRLDSIPVLDPPPLEREVFEAVYLGNQGQSQKLEVAIRASALVGSAMRLHLVGDGVKRRELEALARRLEAPVTFHEPVQGAEVMARYASADTCLVSLRDDWKSFETTVPSKTYEVLAVGRHVTAVVRGEAARVIEEAGAGDIVQSSPQALAELWRGLAEDRSRLVRSGAGRDWVREHADYPVLAERYRALLETLLTARETGRP
jgi:hypothetical protein